MSDEHLIPRRTISSQKEEEENEVWIRDKKFKFTKNMNFKKFIGIKDVILDVEEIDEKTLVLNTRYSNSFVVEI